MKAEFEDESVGIDKSSDPCGDSPSDGSDDGGVDDPGKDDGTKDNSGNDKDKEDTGRGKPLVGGTGLGTSEKPWMHGEGEIKP